MIYQIPLNTFKQAAEIYQNFFEILNTAVSLAFWRFAKFEFFCGQDIIFWKTVIFLRLRENIHVVYRCNSLDLFFIVGLNCRHQIILQKSRWLLVKKSY